MIVKMHWYQWVQVIAFAYSMVGKTGFGSIQQLSMCFQIDATLVSMSIQGLGDLKAQVLPSSSLHNSYSVSIVEIYLHQNLMVSYFDSLKYSLMEILVIVSYDIFQLGLCFNFYQKRF